MPSDLNPFMFESFLLWIPSYLNPTFPSGFHVWIPSDLNPFWLESHQIFKFEFLQIWIISDYGSLQVFKLGSLQILILLYSNPSDFEFWIPSDLNPFRFESLRICILSDLNTFGFEWELNFFIFKSFRVWIPTDLNPFRFEFL